MTVPDDTVIPVRGTFTKTWRLRNTGTCTWTNGYRFVFLRGANLSSPAAVALPGSVAPGQSVDISVTLIAPPTPGVYQAFYMLQAPSGQQFGLGLAGDQPVWVKIRAEFDPTAPVFTPQATAAPGTGLDMIAQACEAQWAGPGGQIPCPSGQGSAGSPVSILDNPRLEDGSQASSAALRIQPVQSDGPIQALYPAYYILPGDRFQASVSCEQGADLCSVLFEVAYRDASGAEHLLWSFGEFQDGRYYNVDLDLAPVSGQQVDLILRVSPLGSAQGDRALWVGPRIVHTLVSTGTPEPVSTLVPATSTIVPTDTPSLPAPVPTTAPTSAPDPQPNPPSFFQQIIDAILNFLRQLFGR